LTNPDSSPKIIRKRRVLEILAAAHQLPPGRTPEEIDRDLQEERNSWDSEDEYPDWTSEELMQLAMQGDVFDFLQDEPDLYTFEDGEPIQWE
jgi:hypothetical protein